MQVLLSTVSWACVPVNVGRAGYWNAQILTADKKYKTCSWWKNVFWKRGNTHTCLSAFAAVHVQDCISVATELVFERRTTGEKRACQSSCLSFFSPAAFLAFPITLEWVSEYKVKEKSDRYPRKKPSGGGGGGTILAGKQNYAGPG